MKRSLVEPQPRSGFSVGQALAALSFLALSAGYLLQASRYPYADDTGPGAGFFPIWIGALGSFIAIGLLFTVKRTAAPEETAVPGSRRTIALTLVALTASAFAIEPLGFRVTAFLLLTVLLRIYGVAWISALLTGLIGSLLIFFLFGALRVQLPVNSFGF